MRDGPPRVPVMALTLREEKGGFCLSPRIGCGPVFPQCPLSVTSVPCVSSQCPPCVPPVYPSAPPVSLVSPQCPPVPASAPRCPSCPMYPPVFPQDPPWCPPGIPHVPQYPPWAPPVSLWWPPASPQYPPGVPPVSPLCPPSAPQCPFPVSSQCPLCVPPVPPGAPQHHRSAPPSPLVSPQCPVMLGRARPAHSKLGARFSPTAVLLR